MIIWFVSQRYSASKYFENVKTAFFTVSKTAGLDEIVRIAKEETGVVYSYLEILVCIIQRILYLRPELNRFVVNKRIYQRNLIQYSMVVQRSLRPGAESNETSIKINFDGTESLSQVKEKMDEVIKEAKSSQNDTDKITTTLAKIPHFIMRFVVCMLKWLDKHGLLPRSVMDAEPFHTSFFITDLKSVTRTFAGTLPPPSTESYFSTEEYTMPESAFAERFPVFSAASWR